MTRNKLVSILTKKKEKRKKTSIILFMALDSNKTHQYLPASALEKK